MSPQQKQMLTQLLDDLRRASPGRDTQYAMQDSPGGIVWSPPEDAPIGYLLYTATPAGAVICCRNGAGRYPVVTPSAEAVPT
jgi:hypothetical protein